MSTKPPSPVVPTKDSRIVHLVRTVRPATLDGQPVEPQPPAARIDIRVSTADTVQPTPGIPRPKGQRVDWDAMEPYYHEGILSLKQLGLNYGVSAPAIVKHAAKHKWKRTVLNKAREVAEEKIASALVVREQQASAQTLDNEPDNDTPEVNTPTRKQVNAERVALTVETYSDVLMRVRMGQHDRFSRVAQLCMEMFEELEEQVANRPLLNELGDLMLRPNDQGIDRLNDIYRKVIDFPGQVRAMKDLADVIGQLNGWESRAFRLDTAPLDGTNKKRNLTVRFVDAPLVERVDGDDDAAK